MRLVPLLTSVHKWLGLVVGVQIVLWCVSGAFFALAPIERVRSEHRLAAQAPVALPRDALANLDGVLRTLTQAPSEVTVTHRLARPVALISFTEGAPRLYDLTTGARLSPISADQAAAAARAAIADAGAVRAVQRVTAETPEYRGALPAWRVAFADREGLAVYVAVDTGAVTARRSDLWRVYDALWALHIMDWRDHENFNTGLLIAFALAALIASLAGIALLPYKLRLRSRRSG